jgi:hypothetical protein
MLSTKKAVDARDKSAFTRVHSPSKTGVNALMDTLWRGHDEPRVPCIGISLSTFPLPRTSARPYKFLEQRGSAEDNS